jgi:XTP/dITP diphosphohydrolase
MRVTFVTTNSHKVREIQGILRPFGISVRWRRKALPEPQAETLGEVVRSKLEAVPTSWDPALVEDSGLFLDGLAGFPGVYSRYVYDTIGLEGILRLLRGRPRGAVFRTVAGVRIRGRPMLVEGVVPGSIARVRRGRGGFGYDPIFVPEGSRQTYAEMGRAEKGETSHRARAFRALAARLAPNSKNARR